MRAGLTVGVFAWVAACGIAVPADAPVAGVVVEPSEAVIPPGESVLFAATLLDAHGRLLDGREIRWESSDESVAWIDDTGLATGVSEGEVEIAATAEDVRGTAELVVGIMEP